MLVGLIVTGMALFVGLSSRHPLVLERLGGPIRAELAVLVAGAALFLLGRIILGGKG